VADACVGRSRHPDSVRANASHRNVEMTNPVSPESPVRIEKVAEFAARLRKCGEYSRHGKHGNPSAVGEVVLTAADLIEAQQQQIDRLREALTTAIASWRKQADALNKRSDAYPSNTTHVGICDGRAEGLRTAAANLESALASLSVMDKEKRRSGVVTVTELPYRCDTEPSPSWSERSHRGGHA
jgi:hypothetical protein